MQDAALYTGRDVYLEHATADAAIESLEKTILHGTIGVDEGGGDSFFRSAVHVPRLHSAIL
jgi:hypothetical protein